MGIGIIAGCIAAAVSAAVIAPILFSIGVMITAMMAAIGQIRDLKEKDELLEDIADYIGRLKALKSKVKNNDLREKIEGTINKFEALQQSAIRNYIRLAK